MPSLPLSRIRRSQLFLLLASLVLVVASHSCGRSSPPAQSQNPPAASQPQTAAPPVQQPASSEPSSSPSSSEPHAVKAVFRNVMFHLTSDASAHLETVSGDLWPAGKYDMPVFDDKTSFELHIANGTISITPAALAFIMNTHVFTREDAPLKDISVEIKDNRLIIKGKLHRKTDLPFETAGDLTINSDGRLRLHTEKVKALHVPVKKVMSLFGIELANVINTSKIPGMDTDKNDILFDLGDLLPPPHIRGKAAAARLTKSSIVVIYGDGGRTFSASERGNYMSFHGNRVKFGKLTMENTDLTILDLDPNDPLDWYQDLYRQQLVAGYTIITESFGLRTFVKDFSKLRKGDTHTAPPQPRPAEP